MNKFLYIFCILLIVSCKKEKLPELPQGNSPIFSIQGEIDGQPISINAGNDNYYMHSSKFDLNNITQWQGSLSNELNSFEITLSDGIVDVPNSTFNLKDLNYFGISQMPLVPLLHLDKSYFTNAEFIDHITWLVNGEVYANQGPLIIYEPGFYDICAQVVFLDQSKASNCSELILGYDKNAKGALKFIHGQNNTIVAFFDTPEYEIDYVEWFYNDSIAITNVINWTFQMSQNVCNLKAIVHYSNGVVRTRSAYIDNVNIQNYIQDLTSFENQSSFSWDFKLRFNIKYGGQNYTSIESTTNSSQLQVLSIEDYGVNSAGDKILMVKGTLNAPFFHVESETVVNASLTMSFALPYK